MSPLRSTALAKFVTTALSLTAWGATTLMSTSVNAAELLDIGVLPASTQSILLPTGFQGIGMQVGYYHFLGVHTTGVGAVGFVQGSAQAMAFPFRLYLSGTAPVSRSKSPAAEADPDIRPIAVDYSPNPFFVDIGPAIYRIGNTPNVRQGTEFYVGGAIYLNAGTTINLGFGRLYFQAGTIRSFSGYVQSFISSAGLSLPFSVTPN